MRRSISMGAAAAALVATNFAASCSSSPDGSGSMGDEVTDAGMKACAPLQAGCYVASGRYTPPATASCSPAGRAKTGPADTHCKGAPPQEVSAASCSMMQSGPADAGQGDAEVEGGNADAGLPAGVCGAPPGNVASPSSDYGATMYGIEGDDDDCKYHVSYEATPICEKDGVYFVVEARYLTRSGAPLTGACAYAELCLDNSHPGPVADGRPPAGKQLVVEGPPGTYTIGPVEFDAPGTWTVRFHFNEECCDVSESSPHGHAAFFVEVP